MAEWTPDDWVAERRVIVSADPAEVARRVGKRLVSKLIALTTEKEIVHVSLTGGGAGIASLREVAARRDRDDVDWSRVHVWWSDERFLPAGDPERNEVQAHAALLDALQIPEGNIHAVAASDAGLSVEDAAIAYEHTLATFACTKPDGSRQPWPSFDICLLGVGPDAHIASLFPDRPEILVTDRAAVPVLDSPKPPPLRVSLTRPVINSSERLWLVLTGAEKAAALGLALAGASYASVPAAGAKGRRRTTFFVDTASAAQVPPELISR